MAEIMEFKRILFYNNRTISIINTAFHFIL